MKKINLIFLALSISLILHIVIFFPFSLRIEGKTSPIIYSWLNIVTKKDLSFSKKEIVFPAGVIFSTDDIRREYFSPSFLTRRYFAKGQDKYHLKVSLAKDSSALYQEGEGGRSDYFFLWQKPYSFASGNEEIVPYRVFVSSHGKVIFMYPEKLPVNSYENLHLQEYIRKACFFLNDKFFWTKLEGVVK